MSDESRLEQAMTRAARAQNLLDHELLSEGFAALEQGYISAWRATTIDDVSAREKLFLAINIVGKVRNHLASVVADGRRSCGSSRRPRSGGGALGYCEPKRRCLRQPQGERLTMFLFCSMGREVLIHRAAGRSRP